MRIGLDNVYYSKITEDSSGYETYATPKKFAPAINANIDIENEHQDFYADDQLDTTFDSFVKGTFGCNMKELTPEAQKDVLGAVLDALGGVILASEDDPEPVAVVLRSMISPNQYAYYVLYRVQFAQPGRQFNTKGSSITINTPTIQGTIMRRHKPAYNGDHPYMYALEDDGTSAVATAIANWFSSVYEPTAPSSSSSTQ